MRTGLIGITLALAAGLMLIGSCGNEGADGDAAQGGAKGGSGATEKAPRVAFVTNGVAPFWTIAKKGAEDAGNATGAKVTVHMPSEGLTAQKQILEDLITRNVDGIAVSPINPADQTELLNEVADHTSLITHDSDAPESRRLCYVGMDNYEAGRLCGELVKEALPDGGEVFIFVGRLEQENAMGRRQGLIDELLDRSYDPTRFDRAGQVITGDRFTILGTLTDQFDMTQAKANAEDAMSKHPELDCMVGLFTYNPPLCLEALKQAGKLGEIKVVAFDEADETLQGIIDGTVHATVVQNPYMYGYKSVEILSALARGEDPGIPESGVINYPGRQIRRDNVEAFWEDLKSKLGG